MVTKIHSSKGAIQQTRVHTRNQVTKRSK